MCTPSVNALQQFNVNNTKNTPVFHLHVPDLLAACNDTGPLPFCLVPPASRLKSMCTSTLDTYFLSVLDKGDGFTLEDMPIIWDSLRELTEAPWIDIENSSQFVEENGTYFGLQPLPDFMSVAASGASRVLLGCSGGTCFKTQNGFMEPQETVTGANDTFQRVAINSLGDRGCVLFRNALFFFNGDSFAQVHQPSNIVNQWMSLREVGTTNVVRVTVVSRDLFTANCICSTYESVSNNFFLVSTFATTLATAEFVAWVCESNSFGTLVAIGTLGQGNYRVHATRQTPFVQLWPNVPWADSIAYDIGGWDAVCRETDTQVWITAANKLQKRAQIVQLDKFLVALGSAAFVSGNVTCIQESLNQSLFAFVSSNSTTMINVCGANDVIASPTPVTGFQDLLSWHGNLAFAADNSKLWYISLRSSGSKLWSNNMEANVFSPLFVSDFELKLATDMHVSDFGLPTINVRPKTTWFFGYRIVARAQPGFSYNSPHEYYRINIDPAIVASQTQFPHVTTQLQRANFQTLAQNSKVRLFNNSQTQIMQSDTTVAFARNTANTWGEDQATDENFNVVLYRGQETRAISPNGLYILYTPDAKFGVGPRVVMNIFNSSVFALYCATDERLSKALAQQSLFCWQHLFEPEQPNLDDMFLDKRCVCIAGKRLVDTLYPALDSETKAWNSSLARMNENFPCLSQTCQRAIAQPELTNANTTTQNKCQNADMTICTSTLAVLDNQSTLTIRLGAITQECNGSIGLQCSQDEACPFGSVCVNGRCTINCKTNQECALGSTCTNGVCLFPNAASDFTQASNVNRTVAQWTLVALAILVLILIIVLIVILRKKK